MHQASVSEITSADLMCERMAAAESCVSLPQSADSSLLNPLHCEGVWAASMCCPSARRRQYEVRNDQVATC